jgi:LacI family transcriptional regulator
MYAVKIATGFVLAENDTMGRRARISKDDEGARGDDGRLSVEPGRNGGGLRQVARAAGVSTATVSRAINTPEIVSADLRERIAAAVKQLGWVPDGAARALTTRCSRRQMPFVNTFVYDAATHGTCIGPDNRKALISITDYLLDLGHVRFGVIAQSTRNNDRASARLEGIRDALAMRGLGIRPQHFAIGEWTIAEGRNLFRRVIGAQPTPTAIICGNAHLAVGAVLEALEMGISVPEQVSIVGYDDIEIMSHLPVPVTTVRVRGQEVGQNAAQLLVARVERRAINIPLESEAELVVRASSGPPPSE